jgi:hypothetical protein
MGESVGKLLTGGLLSGDLPGRPDRGMYSTTRLVVEDGVGELLGPIAVWVVVGVTLLVGIEFVAVGAILMGVPNVGLLLFGAGVIAVALSVLAAASLTFVAVEEEREAAGDRA